MKNKLLLIVLLSVLCNSCTNIWMEDLVGHLIKKPDEPYAVLGETGPGGGVVFYDKGNSSDGWRYMEASKQTNLGYGILWSTATGSINTSPFIGSGKNNTELITAEYPGDTDNAAWKCKSYNGGGYNDWFLPSLDEFNELLSSDLGIFSYNEYWTSSQLSANNAYYFTVIPPFANSAVKTSAAYSFLPVRRF